jgi:site-specific DNA recombinase
MMLQMLGSFAELDRKRIAENTFRGHATKAREGGYRGGWVNFGHVVEGEGRTAKLVEHPQHAAEVLRMFEAYDAGVTCPRLAVDLERRGIPTSKGGLRWRANSVLAILRNPIYTGRGQWARRQWVTETDDEGVETRHLRRTPERAVETRVPVIVPQELFDRVQVKLRANQIAAMAHRTHDFLLVEMIRCGICGRRFCARGDYYVCGGRHYAKREERPPCPAPILRREDIETAVWEHIQGYLRVPGDALDQLKKQMAVESSALALAEKIRAGERERALQEKKRERIQLLYVDGGITREKRREMEERVASALDAIEEKIRALRQVERDHAQRALSLDDAKSVLESLREAADGEIPFAEKRTLAQTLVDSIQVMKDGRTRITFVFESDAPRRSRFFETRTAPSYATA